MLGFPDFKKCHRSSDEFLPIVDACGRTIPQEWLLEKVSGGVEPGAGADAVAKLSAIAGPGDEIWRYGHQSAPLAGEQGYVLMRGGVPFKYIITLMS